MYLYPYKRLIIHREKFHLINVFYFTIYLSYYRYSQLFSLISLNKKDQSKVNKLRQSLRCILTENRYYCSLILVN